jgi:chromosome partitioning protein
MSLSNGTLMSKVIAVFNQSGGVGKSTLTMNLGYHLAQRKKKVLLVDMDPQGSLTAFMGLEPSELDKTIYESVMAGEPLPIHSGIHGMDLVPANIDLSGAELELVVADLRDYRLKEALSEAVDQYDFILIDCPPSLGILSYISLVAATHVLIPIQTQYKSLKGTELLLSTIARVRSRANKKLSVAGVVPTMHEARTVQGSMALQSIQEQLSKIGTVFATIPRSVSFADASQEHVPLALYSPKHPAVHLFNQIARSLEKLP